MLPTLTDGRVTLRTPSEDDLDALAEMIARPEMAEWWGWVDETADLREDLRSDGDAFAVDADGALAGWLGFYEEQEPGYRHASLDIMLAPEHQDRGIGRAALRLAARWFVHERGHHRLTIDPALHNERAIRTYAAVGFRPVGVMRRYERGADGTWHDSLLMDLLAEEL